MEKRKTIIIGLTGHIISDQRINRIATTFAENHFRVLVYYRSYFKFKPVDGPLVFPFETRAIHAVFTSGVLFYLWYNLLLFFKLLWVKTDYLYAVDSDTLPAFICLSFFKRKPFVFDSHEYFAEVPELSASPLKKKIWHQVTEWGVRRSMVNITVGPELATVLEKRYGKPFISLRNVPFYAALTPVEKLQPPVILYQGALNAGRELELLIETMKDLPECRCIIAGEGDLSQALRDQAKDNRHIEFAGLLSPHALKELTPKCFAGFNLLAPESLSYYYSLSNKYFDYMHAGVPSISSKLPEYMALNSTYQCGECIENTRLDLLLTLRKWMYDEAHYQKLKENAIIASGKLNWENEQTQLLNCFKIS